ncbi:MAG: glycosyltransferase family 39 protein [Crocinitomicaceae bacterium]|nr:glycosyltransferase family 39 protein [Crocinitomicaceae bacterium]
MSLLDRIASQQKWTLGLLALLSGFFFIGLGHIHLFDWDEINFAESAREMIESDNYLRVQINYLPFWEKPPLFFWIQVMSMKLFGIGEYAARFPNALFGAFYLFTFYFIGKRHFSAKFGLIWALVFFASLLPHIYFKSGIIDPVFNFFIFLSIYFMIRVIGKDGNAIWKLALLSGVFSALSVLTKGPVGFLLLGLTLAVYLIYKRFKVFPSIKGILFFLIGFAAIISCWVALEVSQNGWDILWQFIEYQIELFRTPVAGHEQPFYYHFIVVGFGCFPMSVLAIPLFYQRKDETALDLRRWMLSLFWVVLILFSITTTKIIHYSSMTYAPLSFLAALSIYRMIKGELEIKKYVRISFLIVGGIVSLAMLAVPVILMEKNWLLSVTEDPFVVKLIENSPTWTFIDMFGGIIFLAGFIAGFIYLRKGNLSKMLVSLVAGTAVSLLVVLYTIMPKVDQLTQGDAISMYEELEGKDCYVESLRKSYAQYFYVKAKPGARTEEQDLEWMLRGDIDKPVYIGTRSSRFFLDEVEGFEIVKEKGAFKLYRRLPKVTEAGLHTP